MADDTSAGATPQNRPLGQRLKRGLESKILVPVAAMVVSAGASYLVKKLPLILEEKVLPKLRERDAPDRVTNVVEQAAATMGAVTGEGSAGADGKPSQGADDRPDGSAATSTGAQSASRDRDEERRQREERRRARKQALGRAA